MDSLAMILLTIPVFFPLIMTLDFGMTPEETAIWFGILTLIVVEVGLITPPVGLNVFIINKLAGDVSISETFKGVLPFLISDICRVILLFSFPIYLRIIGGYSELSRLTPIGGICFFLAWSLISVHSVSRIISSHKTGQN